MAYHKSFIILGNPFHLDDEVCHERILEVIFNVFEDVDYKTYRDLLEGN